MAQTSLVPFRVTNFIRLDKLPSFEDLRLECDIWEFIQKKRKEFNYLLPDLWNIVLSFFWGHYKQVNVSVPLREIFDVPPMGSVSEMNIQRLVLHHQILYFYGREDGEDFEFTISNGDYSAFARKYKVSGHYPLNTSGIHRSPVEMGAYDWAQNHARFLVCIEPRFTNTQADDNVFIWHKNYSQTLKPIIRDGKRYSDSAWLDKLHTEHPDIPAFQILNGVLFGFRP